MKPGPPTVPPMPIPTPSVVAISRNSVGRITGASQQGSKQPEKLGKVQPTLFGDVFFDALVCVLLSENLRLREMEIERYELSPDRGRLGVVAWDGKKLYRGTVTYSELDGCTPGAVAILLEERLKETRERKSKRSSFLRW